MNEFKVGDRVKSTRGLYAGEKGIITFLNKNYPNFCRVQYDGYKGETVEFTARIELLPAEPAQRTIHCGLCGHEYNVATEFQSATIKCECGDVLDYFKFDDGRISITATTTEVNDDDDD